MTSDSHFIPDELATRTARLINEAEDMRAQAVEDLKTIYGDLREELKALGWLGQNISKEVAALKAAISEMRLDEEQKAKREEKGDRIDDYVALLSRSRAGARARTREGNAYAEAKLIETVAAGVQTETGRKALIAKPKFVLRPHCLNPGESCGGYSDKHCHACTVAMRKREQAEEVA
jgi:Skp family chaperone for outer membrane proteins